MLSVETMRDFHPQPGVAEFALGGRQLNRPSAERNDMIMTYGALVAQAKQAVQVQLLRQPPEVITGFPGGAANRRLKSLTKRSSTPLAASSVEALASRSSLRSRS